MIEHKEFTDIPTCWNSSKVRYIYSITKAKMPTELLDNPEDGTEIYLSMDVIRKRNENLQYSQDVYKRQALYSAVLRINNISKSAMLYLQLWLKQLQINLLRY